MCCGGERITTWMPTAVVGDAKEKHTERPDVAGDEQCRGQGGKLFCNRATSADIFCVLFKKDAAFLLIFLGQFRSSPD